ncbi:MAG: hypothetical protein ACKVZJ_02495 [Phycisphaerales bacterium]
MEFPVAAFARPFEGLDWSSARKKVRLMAGGVNAFDEGTERLGSIVVGSERSAGPRTERAGTCLPLAPVPVPEG